MRREREKKGEKICERASQVGEKGPRDLRERKRGRASLCSCPSLLLLLLSRPSLKEKKKEERERERKRGESEIENVSSFFIAFLSLFSSREPFFILFPPFFVPFDV